MEASPKGVSVKGVVYQEPYEVTVEEKPDPKIEAPNDAVIRLTTTNIYGSDLHMYEAQPRPSPTLSLATRTRESSRRSTPGSRRSRLAQGWPLERSNTGTDGRDASRP